MSCVFEALNIRECASANEEQVFNIARSAEGDGASSAISSAYPTAPT